MGPLRKDLNNGNNTTNVYLLDGEEPGPFDIICERGVTGTSHQGNKYFNLLILDWRPLYSGMFLEITDDHKKSIVAHIIRYIQWGREQPGRFLSRDKDSRKWYESPPIVAQKRVAQALRDAHTPQWVYQEKLEELRPIYYQCGSEDERSKLVYFLFVFLRGGRLQKGHFVHWKSTRVRNLDGGKRRFKTETTNTDVEDDFVMEWIRKDVESAEAHGLNEGIKYVIDSGGGQLSLKKKRGSEAAHVNSSTTSLIANVRAMSLTKNGGMPNAPMVVAPPVPAFSHVSTSLDNHSKRSLARTITKKLKRTQQEELDQLEGDDDILDDEKIIPMKRASNMKHPLFRQRRERPGRDRTPRDIQDGGGDPLRQQSTHSTDSTVKIEKVSAAQLEPLRAMFEARKAPPVAEIVLGDDFGLPNLPSGGLLDTDDSMRSMRGEMDLNDNSSGRRWRSSLRSSRSFSVRRFDDQSTNLSDNMSIGGNGGGGRKRSQSMDRAAAALVSSGLVASPCSMLSTLTGAMSLQDRMSNLLNEDQQPQAPPFHSNDDEFKALNGSLPLNDAGSTMGTISMASSSHHQNHSLANTVTRPASPSSSLCAPVSPSMIFS
eukprot:Nitzschia sp. Nitz4//scaffold181_size46380//27479//29278//NITZ4_007179-RA/size46380-processed-gene-0.34-mRNA-1//-1//CDS//3329539516//7436//frame0